LIDRSRIGYSTEPTMHTVGAWRVKLFCQAIGETNPAFHDAGAAQRSGNEAGPVPPTFLKALESEHQSGAALMKLVDAPLAGVLHAEQSFEFASPVHVGDVVEISRTIVDIFDKRDGAITLIIVDSTFCVAGRMVARGHQTIMVRSTVPSSER